MDPTQAADPLDMIDPTLEVDIQIAALRRQAELTEPCPVSPLQALKALLYVVEAMRDDAKGRAPRPPSVKAALLQLDQDLAGTGGVSWAQVVRPLFRGDTLKTDFGLTIVEMIELVWTRQASALLLRLDRDVPPRVSAREGRIAPRKDRPLPEGDEDAYTDVVPDRPLDVTPHE